MILHPQYVVNDNGKRTGVILSLDEYLRLVEALEDQLDAADLDDAVENERDFVPYGQVQDDLRAEGKL